MENQIKCFLRRILEKRLDVWFFYGFLITFTLSIRKVITFYPIKNDFNEYTGIYLYLSDLFLIATILLWGLYILCNNFTYLSSCRLSCFTPKKMFHMEHPTGQAWNNIKNNFFKLSNKSIVFLPLILVIWAFISILWSENQVIAFFRSIKLLEFYLLFLYIKYNLDLSVFKNRNVSRGTSILENKTVEKVNIIKIKHFLTIIIGIGLFNALLAFLQKAQNGSVGLYFLKESLFNTSIPGVAKITLGSSLFVRPYGLFPHPNLLGLFLLFTIVTILVYLNIFDLKQKSCSTWNIFKSKCKNCFTWNIFKFFKNIFFFDKIVSRGTFDEKNSKIKNENFSSEDTENCFTWNKKSFSWNFLKKFSFSGRQAILFSLILIIPLFALFLTFSKNAVIGLFTALLFISYSSYLVKNGSNELNIANLLPFLKEKLLSRQNLLIIAILIMLLINLRPSSESFISTSLNDRIIFQDVSRGTISDNLFTGVGMGQFVTTMNDYSAMPLLKWQYQPVHNVFSLIWSELGLIGLIIFIAFIWSVLKTFRSIPNDSKMFHACPIGCSTWNILFGVKTAFRALFIAFIIMMLFDHHFWDIQQGQALFWMVLALI